MHMAKKIFVLQTSVLTSSVDSTLRFGSDAEIVIPLDIIRELGDCAVNFTAKGQIARRVLEYFDSFSMRALKSPEGVRQKNNSILRIEDGFRDVPVSLSVELKRTDRRCFQIALGIKKQNASVVLVTKNPQTRLLAEFVGIKAQPFRDDLFPALEEQYTGRAEVTTSSLKLDRFFADGFMKVTDIHHYASIEWMPNLFLQITAVDDTKKSALARFDGTKIVKLKFDEFHPFAITAKNAGQYMLMEALLEPPETAPIVIAKGGAGTGKTFTSMAVALHNTIEPDSIYSQILITAPIQTVGGEKIGFLPGEIEEKFNPHIGGIKDNIRILLNAEDKKSKGKKTQVEDGKYLFEHGFIQVQPIGFLRGRTIVDTIFIIDETQNIEPEDIKSIVTRAATGSKFVFLGDPTQIDNPNLNERYNGLVYLSEKMKDSPLAWQVALNENESVRSELARYASKIL